MYRKTLAIACLLLLSLTAAQGTIIIRRAAAGGITFVDGSAAQSADATSITVTKPTGLQDDDVLVSWVELTDLNLAGDTWTCESGWTKSTESECTAGKDRLTALCYKVVTSAAGEPSTYTHDHSETGTPARVMGHIAAFRGVDTVTPLSVSPDIDCFSNDPTPVSPSITTAENGEMVVIFGYCYGIATDISDDNGDSTAIDETLGDSQNSESAYWVKATAGATAATTWTCTGSPAAAESVGATFSLDPA